jgi:hypothetical protein
MIPYPDTDLVATPEWIMAVTDAINMFTGPEPTMDTGWRDVEADLNTGYNAVSFYIRRVGNRVILAWKNLTGVDNLSAYPLPEGFRGPFPDLSQRIAVARQADIILNTSHAVSFASALLSYNNHFLIASWITFDEWPETYPGTDVP